MPTDKELDGAWPGKAGTLEDAIRATESVATAWKTGPGAPKQPELLADRHRLALLRWSERHGQFEVLARLYPEGAVSGRTGQLLLAGAPKLRGVPIDAEVEVYDDASVSLSTSPRLDLSPWLVPVVVELVEQNHAVGLETGVEVRAPSKAAFDAMVSLVLSFDPSESKLHLANWNPEVEGMEFWENSNTERTELLLNANVP